MTIIRELFCIMVSLGCHCVVSNEFEFKDLSKKIPADQIPQEVRLVQALKSRYEQLGTVARPTWNSTRLMKVQFGMRLIQMDVIEKEQTLKTSVWIRARWVDEFMQWDPDEFGGIQQIVMPWKEVWTPDIVLVNTAVTDVGERPADVMVNYQGGVFWSPHRMYWSACMIDVTNFPYDRHTCHMWFQSMARFSWQMDLWPYGKNALDLSTYIASFKESQEWEIQENSTERFTESRGVGVMLKFSRRVALRFSITVQRRQGYTCHLLMLPCVLLGCLTLVIFLLPPERPDRHTLATSLLGSFLVLTLILAGVAPPTASSVPKLGIYYTCNMTLVMISIFLSGMVINISKRGDRKQLVPTIVQKVVIGGMSRLLLLHGRMSPNFLHKITLIHRDDDLEGITVESIKENNDIRSNAVTPEIEKVNTDMQMDNMSETHYVELDPLTGSNGAKKSFSKDAMSPLCKPSRTKHTDNKYLPADKKLSILKAQWMSIALVFDRLFFFVYLITIATTFYIMFPRPSYI